MVSRAKVGVLEVLSLIPREKGRVGQWRRNRSGSWAFSAVHSRVEPSFRVSCKTRIFSVEPG